MELNEKSFIELLRKSESFVINESFNRVKNAKVLAVYSDTKSVLFQDPTDKKLYYANYKLTEDDVMQEYGEPPNELITEIGDDDNINKDELPEIF